MLPLHLTPGLKYPYAPIYPHEFVKRSSVMLLLWQDINRVALTNMEQVLALHLGAKVMLPLDPRTQVHLGSGIKNGLNVSQKSQIY